MEHYRKIQRLSKSQATIEGAGVHLKRAFGFRETAPFDPFLLLDDFRANDPRFYSAGFPWHPHRGIETITYILHGQVEHRDSLGNAGVIGPGDVQWMTAGSGIIHQEMPQGDVDGRMGGFQLWANLPASHKMMHPRYQDITSPQIPEILTPGGVKLRVICGEVEGVPGPVQDIITDPEYLDITVPADAEFVHPTRPGHTVFAYVIEGQGRFFQDRSDSTPVTNETLVLFEDGEGVAMATGAEPVRFLLIAGKAIGEPVAWYGPIVMNTRQELETAFAEYQNGTFLKHNP